MSAFRIGYENNNDERTIAWALNYPGCYAYGADQLAAETNFPDAARKYVAWVGAHGGAWLQPGDESGLINEETFDAYFVDATFDRVERGGGSMVESFFRHDWKPLTAEDIDRALQSLEWTRQDLFNVIEPLTPMQLRQKADGERWDINGILNHIGSAEWWYQERLGHPFPAREEDLPPEPLRRLELVRGHLLRLLPQMQGVDRVLGLDGELWSPRKMLRRALWHERDHTEHIRKLI